MKKITLVSALLMAMTSVNAQSVSIVANDPQNDAGAMGVDVKNLSYELSADKKDVTFKFETYGTMSSWNNAGFMFYIDSDLDPSTGLTPDCANKSMKADKLFTCLNMMNVWYITETTPSNTKGTDVGKQVAITIVDPKTTTVKIPLSLLDADGDGKFNMLAATAAAGSSAFYIDDLPNTNYSKLSVLNPTSIKTINAMKFNVYPNPASSLVKFSTTESINGNISVYDLIGREVASETINGNNTTIVVSHLVSGTYIYRVTNKDNAIVNTGKLSIQ